MENMISPIEKLPFFKGFHSKGKAIVDVKVLEEWLTKNKGIELLSEEDERDRGQAFEELERDEALDLREALKKWYRAGRGLSGSAKRRMASLNPYRRNNGNQ